MNVKMTSKPTICAVGLTVPTVQMPVVTLTCDSAPDGIKVTGLVRVWSIP
jgi:hypothetical protein